MANIIPITNEITQFIHCSKCAEEIPDGITPSDWQRFEIGFTKLGIQVWCKRHNCNIVHIDFDGIQHHANTNKKK